MYVISKEELFERTKAPLFGVGYFYVDVKRVETFQTYCHNL